MSELTKEELDKKEKRKLYYTEYYQKNRDRLLQYQHTYNEQHSLNKKKMVANNDRRWGRLATTRNNIQKRLAEVEKKAQAFRTTLAQEKASSLLL